MIFRFHVNLPGCDILVKRFSRQTNPCHDIMPGVFGGFVSSACFFGVFFEQRMLNFCTPSMLEW